MLTGIPGPTFEIPRPRHTGGLVLYLDYDGVLHPESVYLWRGKGPGLVDAPGHSLFEHAGLLESVLMPYPDVKIVLSTAWVRVYGSAAKVARKLPPDLRSRVVGATFHRRMDAESFRQASRGMQVWSDVLRRKPVDWLAVDDDYHDWPAWCRDRLVKSHEILGISAPVVLAQLRAKLALMHGESP